MAVSVGVHPLFCNMTLLSFFISFPHPHSYWKASGWVLEFSTLTMHLSWGFSLLLLYFAADIVNGFSSSSYLIPSAVNVGAILDFNSTIGRAAKIAIEEAVKDVNSDSSILPGTKLLVDMKDSGCNQFLGLGEALQFMKTETIAVIGPQSSIVTHLALYVTNQSQLPMLSFGATDPSLSRLEFPFLVRTTHSDLYQMTAIADIINYYGWKQVIAIYIDDEFGRNGIAALEVALVERRSKISHKLRIPPGPDVSREDIVNILVQVALSESRVIVLHAYPDTGFMVLSIARYLGIMGEGYAWIATDWLSSVLDSSSPLPSKTMDALQGVLVLRQHTPHSERKKAFLSRWNKLTAGSIGLNTYALYAYDTVWLVSHAIDSFFNRGGIVSFSNYSIPPSTELHTHITDGLLVFDGGKLLLKQILQSNFVGLTGLIKFNPDRSLTFPSYDIVNVVGTRYKNIGYWSNHSHLSTVLPEISYSKPSNLSSSSQQLHVVLWPGDTLLKPRGWVFPNNGDQLRIGVPIPVSFKDFVLQVKGTDAFKGYCIDVFRAAINLLPYAVPYQFIAYGDGQVTPNYTELVKLVSTGFFDAAIGDIAIVTERSKIVDFTQPFAASGLVVVAPFRKLNTGAWAFLRPLSLPVWGFIAGSLPFVGMVVWILERRVNDEFRGTPKSQLSTILWFSFSSLFGAHRQNTMSTLGRIVLLIWLFVVLILNESYTASLSSMFLVQHLSSSIKGIETLKMIDDPIGYPVGSFVEHYLSKEIGIPKSRLVPLASPEDYAMALQRGPQNGGVAAVVDERPYIELFLSIHCKFKIVGQAFTKGGWGFAFPRDSPLAVDMSTAILSLSENGDLKRIHEEWFTSTTCRFENKEIESDRLHLESFWGLYLIIGIACFISLVIYFSRITCQLRSTQKPGFVPSAEGESRSTHRPNSEGGSRCRHLPGLLRSMHKNRGYSEREKKRRKVEK